MSNRFRSHRLFGRVSLLVSTSFLLAVPVLFAFNVRLKDGSIIFARAPYEVKGRKAIITLENGTVTQIDLEKIDIPGTEKYNRENPGNVIAIETVDSKSASTTIVTPKPTSSLQEMIRRKQISFNAPRPKAGSPADRTASTGTLWQPVDQAVEVAFRNVFDGAGITQYRLANYRGKVRLLATGNTEEAVFNTLSASARALSDLANRGKETTIEIALTTSGGESGGSFEMNPEQARLLINGSLPVAEYFIKNVIF